MPPVQGKIKIIFIFVAALLVVGIFPLLLTGYLLSDKSGRELRSAENRYQIQLVQEKARQIEMFSRRYESVVSNLATGFQFSGQPASLLAPSTESRLGDYLKKDASSYSTRIGAFRLPGCAP